MTNSIADLAQSDVILVVGSNTTEAHPVIGLALKAAARRGAELIVADPRRIRLVDHARQWLRLRPGTNVALANGIAHVIAKEGLADQAFISSRTEGFEAFSQGLSAYDPESVEAITDVPAEDIRRAARTYATAGAASIVYCMGVTQHSSGTDQVLSLANLAMMTGNIGRPGTGVNPLRGQNNVQGACDVGCLPPFLPGYRRVDDPDARAAFARAWGRDVPDEAGLTLVEIMDAVADGRIQALYVMGENPVVSDPDQAHVVEALESASFLVVQDIFLTETARLADVVLPGVSFAEKDGTFTNTERRVQRVRAAIPPVGDSRPDVDILGELLERFGLGKGGAEAADVMAEIASLTPSYAGITYERLADGGIQWPCPDSSHPGTPVLHTERFARGAGRFVPVDYAAPAEVPDADYPMMMTTGRVLTHYHTGSMTRRANGLSELCPHGVAEVSPADAERLGLCDGDWIEVSSRRGSIVIRASVTERSPEGVVFVPFHYAEAPANRLTGRALDPVAKIPAFKTNAVRLRRVERPA